MKLITVIFLSDLGELADWQFQIHSTFYSLYYSSIAKNELQGRKNGVLVFANLFLFLGWKYFGEYIFLTYYCDDEVDRQALNVWWGGVDSILGKWITLLVCLKWVEFVQWNILGFSLFIRPSWTLEIIIISGSKAFPFVFIYWL